MIAESIVLASPNMVEFIDDISSKSGENLSWNSAEWSDQIFYDAKITVSTTVSSGPSAASGSTSNGKMPREDEAAAPLDPYTISGLVLVNSTYNVSSGYTALDTTVNGGGTLNVLGGGLATDTVLNNGGAEVLSSGARANLTTVNWGGALHVFSGATASRTTVNQSGYLGVGGGATIVSTTVGEIGQITIWGGGAASQSVIETWGAMILSSGARADGTDIRDKGGLHVYSGAVADNTTVNQGGIFGVGDGAVVNDTNIGVYGELKVWGGGLANRTDIASGGALILLSGAKASGTEIQSGGGLHVYSGAAADATTVYRGGYFGVGDGAVVNDTTIGVYGELKVWGGGLASDSVISSGGAIILLDNADADGTVICSGGGLHVYSGARASRTLVNQGGLFGVGGGANVVSTTVGQAGEVVVWGGGYAAGNTIETWGAMILASGAQADRTDIQANGGLHIYSGALAGDVTIRNGATLGIGGGGKVDGVTEEHGAGMVFYDGSLVSGRIQMGGTVTVNGVLDGSNAEFVFDLSNRTSEEGIILNSVSAVSNANYQVSLSGQQALGQYSLAGGASGFSGSMTVTVNSQAAGSVSVGGPALIVGDLAYSLIRSGSDTLLFGIDIAPADTPPVFPDYSGSAVLSVNGSYKLSWTPATDNAGVTGYTVKIYDGGGQLMTTLNSTENSVNVFLPVGSYTFDVTAYDTANNSITSPQTAFVVEKNIPAPTGNGVVQVYNNGNPILTTTSPLTNYVLPNAAYQMQVFSYGNAIATTITGGAVATINPYGNMYNTKIASGGYLSVRGGYSWDTEVNAGGGAIVAAGIANYNKISGPGAIMEVNNAGTANSVEIEDNGVMILKTGGKMMGGTVSNNGLLYVSSGGTANFATLLSGGVFAIERGAFGQNIQLTDNVYAYISQGATVSGLDVSGNNYLLQIGIDSATNVQVITSGTEYYISNGVMDSGHTYFGTILEVYEGGIVRNLYANGATQFHSGGRGYNIENHQTAQINVFSGGYVSGVKTDTVAETYLYGGAADDIEINSGGYVWIHSGGVANNIRINSAGNLTVSSGAQARNVVISQGAAIVEESNAYISDVELYDRGQIEICGANAENVTVFSGGLLTYSSSFYPMDVTTPVTALNGIANNVTVSSGGALVARFTGIASQVKAYSGAQIQISSASVVRNLEVYDGAVVYLNDQGLLDNAIVSAGGRVDIYPGGSAASLTLTSGATVNLNTAGKINGLQMTDTTMYAPAGSFLTGEIYLNNAVINAYSGSQIEFSLKNRTAGDDFLINDLNSIVGSPTYSITVSSDQNSGIYKLAAGAGAFTGSISISENTSWLGNLSVGDSLSSGTHTYALQKADDNLFLSVTVGAASAMAALGPADIVEEINIDECFNGIQKLQQDGPCIPESFQTDLQTSNIDGSGLLEMHSEFGADSSFIRITDSLQEMSFCLEDKTKTDYAAGNVTEYGSISVVSSGFLYA